MGAEETDVRCQVMFFKQLGIEMKEGERMAVDRRGEVRSKVQRLKEENGHFLSTQCVWKVTRPFRYVSLEHVYEEDSEIIGVVFF